MLFCLISRECVLQYMHHPWFTYASRNIQVRRPCWHWLLTSMRGGQTLVYSLSCGSGSNYHNYIPTKGSHRIVTPRALMHFFMNFESFVSLIESTLLYNAPVHRCTRMADLSYCHTVSIAINVSENMVCMCVIVINVWVLYFFIYLRIVRTYCLYFISLYNYLKPPGNEYEH